MSLYYSDDQVTLLLGDALDELRGLPDESVDCVVTSPPYFGLRDYGVDGQYGLESSPGEYVETMRRVFAEVRRILAVDGTLWLNLSDSYSGSWGNQSRTENSPGLVSATDGRFPAGASRTGAIKPGAPPAKNLLGIPWRVAFALQDDGWILRNDIAWHKPNAMPESVADRLATRYEHLFLLAASPRYWFDLDAIREPLAHPEALGRGIVFGGNGAGAGKVGASARRGGQHRSVYGAGSPGPHHRAANERGRNPGDVWSIPTRPYPEAHFAVFPIELPVRCIKAGCKPGGTVLDPFSGSGTTGGVARSLGRRYIGIDLNPAYHDLAKKRVAQGMLDLGEVAL